MEDNSCSYCQSSCNEKLKFTCSHFICLLCLYVPVAKTIQEQGSEEEDRLQFYVNSRLTINCLKCGTGSYEFQSDNLLKTLTENTYTKQIPVCSNCEECNAEIYCKNCVCALCLKCKDQIHSFKIMKQHSFQTEFPDECTLGPISKCSNCKFEKDALILCEACEDMVCDFCYLNSHKDHKFITMKDFKPNLLKSEFLDNLITCFKDKINLETDYIDSKIEDIKKKIDEYKYEYFTKLIFQQNRICDNIRITQIINTRLEEEYKRASSLKLDQVKIMHLYQLIQKNDALQKPFDINITKFHKEFFETVKQNLLNLTKVEDLFKLENTETNEHELRDEKGKVFLNMENIVNKQGLYDNFVVFEKLDGKKYLAYILNEDFTIRIKEILCKDNKINPSSKSLCLKGHQAEIINLKYVRIEKKDYLVSIGDDNKCIIWELHKFKLKTCIDVALGSSSDLIDFSYFAFKDKHYLIFAISRKENPFVVYDFFSGESLLEMNNEGTCCFMNSFNFNSRVYFLASFKSPCSLVLYECTTRQQGIEFVETWKLSMESKVSNALFFTEMEKPVLIFKDDSSEMIKVDFMTGKIIMHKHIFGCGNLVKLNDNFFIKSVFNSLEILAKSDWKVMKRYDDIHPTTISNLVVLNHSNIGIVLFYKGIDNTLNYFQ